MAFGVRVTGQMSGRDAVPDAHRALDGAIQTLGRDLLDGLRRATPGAAGQGWQLEPLPAERAVRITNAHAYAWYLITGTRPHNIPGAFGRPAPFGMSGRFAGMFHPGTQANKEMRRVIDDLPEGMLVVLRDAAGRVRAQLKGGA